MEISPRRSLSMDYEGSVVSSAASSYPPTCLNCRSDMYTIQGMKSTVDPKVARPFALTSSLSMDSGTQSMLAPKKENFFSNIFNALTNVVMERIAKVPGSFMTNINNTLSVTVVPNEGIISQEFFKTLTRSCEQLASEHTNENKESPSVSEKLPSKSLYDGKSQISYVFADNPKADALATKVTLDYDGIKENSENSGENNKLDVNLTSNLSGDSARISNKNCRISEPTIMGSSAEVVAASEGQYRPSDWAETIGTCRKTPCYSRPAISEVHDSKNEETCASGWHSVWRRVVGGMSERLNSRSSSPDMEVPSKKPNLSSNPHTKSRRRLCTMARVRGKGRGRSQLRRSGVSQSRHRKERTKQNINCNIQDDLEAWEDSEGNDSGEEGSLQGVRENEEPRSPVWDCTKHCSTLFENITFDEAAKPRKRKQGTRDRGNKCPVRVRYVPESSMEVDGESCGSRCIDETERASKSNEFRPRLVSESSVESEDSYCIVFEGSSSSEYTDYEFDTDEELDEDPDEETDEEPDEKLEKDDNTTHRVRFNLKPQIHTMVHWNFAYRAARPGPWEQMARDRDRFRSRIRCIERVLEPVLSSQHRKCVYKDRFDVDG